MSVRDDLKESLPNDPEFRHEYADEILTLLVCSQIKALREQRHMSQTFLGEALGTTQSVVSRIESTNYASWSVDTLRRIARALDVRLRITFEGFGSLWQDVGGISKSALERPKIEKDPEFALEHQATNVLQFRAIAHPRESEVQAIATDASEVFASASAGSVVPLSKSTSNTGASEVLSVPLDQERIELGASYGNA